MGFDCFQGFICSGIVLREGLEGWGLGEGLVEVATLLAGWGEGYWFGVYASLVIVIPACFIFRMTSIFPLHAFINRRQYLRLHLPIHFMFFLQQFLYGYRLRFLYNFPQRQMLLKLFFQLFHCRYLWIRFHNAIYHTLILFINAWSFFLAVGHV